MRPDRRPGLRLGLAEDPVHLGAADGAGPLGHPATVRLGDLTLEVPLLLALDAVAVVGLGHRPFLSFAAVRCHEVASSPASPHPLDPWIGPALTVPVAHPRAGDLRAPTDRLD